MNRAAIVPGLAAGSSKTLVALPARRFACAAVAVLGLLLGVGRVPARAQIIEAPTFQLDGPIFNHLQDVDVSVSTNGTVVFAWAEYDLNTISGANDHTITQWFSQTGVPFTPPVVVDTSEHVFNPALASDTRGGHVSAWLWINYPQEPGYAFFGRMLDSTGRSPDFMQHSDFRIDDRLGPVTPYVRVAGLPSGAVFVWDQSGLVARLYDEFGAPRGDSFLVDPVNATSERQDVALLPDGGFVVAWRHGWQTPMSRGRIFDGNGAPRGPTFVIHDTLHFERIAASPTGELAATLIAFFLEPDNVTFHYELYLQRMDATGAVLGDPSLVVVSDDNFAIEDPDLDFDYQGDVLVTWSEYRTSPWTARVPKGRGFDAAGNPLTPTFDLGNTPSVEVRTHRLTEPAYGGRGFVNVWYALGEAFGSIVSLCNASVSVCGDGVVADQCERCDDGEANSDTQPDACRIDCTLARCGDGVTDGGEECDDHNVAGCDGCSADCRVEDGGACGDGIVLQGCSEECDDGNAIGGDGCSQDCALERIPGGGARTTECFSTWRVDNPTNVPFDDGRGNVNNSQVCVDGDSACDFDGGVVGSCTFHVGVCMRSPLAGCFGNFAVDEWRLISPSASKAARSPALATSRAALLAAASTVGGSGPEACSAFADVVVPMRMKSTGQGRGRLRLKAAASTTLGVDTDSLRLACVSAP